MACSKLETEELSLKEEVGRFCAFCLIPLSASEVRKCGKCERRAYCSTVCQTADWSGRGLVASGRTMGVGQGHKRWCGLTVGEEGLDWAVKEVPGKGRGLIALRDLPSLYRVFVEGWQSLDQPGLEDHPGFKFLSDPPVGVNVTGATPFERKFDWNGTGTQLGFRLAMVNHECDANAAASPDEEFKVSILFTLRPIAAGEEICMQYYGFNWISAGRAARAPDLEKRAVDLLQVHGIICPSHCICKNTQLRKKILEASVLLQSSNRAQNSGQWERALRMNQKAVSLGEEEGFPVHIMANFHGKAYRVCRRHRPANRNSWLVHFNKYDEWSRAVFHPLSKNHFNVEEGPES